jgi:hypothetical protein
VETSPSRRMSTAPQQAIDGARPNRLQIGAEPPQTLLADPDAPDADSHKNKDYEFYALKKFITLTHKSHGTIVKFYSGCRLD